jgi:hypothetical protein
MDPHSNDTPGSKVAPLQSVELNRIHIPGFGSIYRQGERWAAEFWTGGVQHRESARTTREQKAIAHLRRRVEESTQGKYVSARAERVTVADLLKLVTGDYTTAGKRSARTLKYRVAALTFELGHLRANKVSPSAVEAYKAKRLSDGRAKATINRELACLRRAYKLAERTRRSSAPRASFYRDLPRGQRTPGAVGPYGLCSSYWLISQRRSTTL